MSLDSDTSDHKDTRIYRAIISEWDEGYRITLADNPISPGWRDAGKTGSREEVLAWIDVVWSEYDRRPKSLRDKMKELGIEDTRVYQVLIDEGTRLYYPYPLEKGVPPDFASAGITGSMEEMYDWANSHVARPGKEGA
ncbi:MAG TPA: hypothetical protein VF268_15325 [Gammaproteobacteria bacterium]